MSGSMLSTVGLKTIAKGYLHDIDLGPIDKAWDFAAKIMATVSFSGAPSMEHALEVASTLHAP